jgi:glutathione S-transferase
LWEAFVAQKCTIYSWDGFAENESTSPYCLKAIYAARYLKIPFELKYVNGAPSWALRNALPVAEFDSKQIEDSSEILEHLNSLNADSKLYPKDLALEAQVWEDWADENLRCPLVYFRWIHDENWQVFKKAAFKAIPAPIKPIILAVIRNKIRGFLKNHGYLQKPETDKLSALSKTLQLIDQKLGLQPFLLPSKEPTAADISVYAFFVSMLSTQPPQLVPLFSGRKNLIAWMQTMKKLMA